jgi:HEAT repeat protein
MAKLNNMMWGLVFGFLLAGTAYCDDSDKQEQVSDKQPATSSPAVTARVTKLIEALKDKDNATYVRSDAAMALGGIGPAAKAAVPALIEALNDKGFNVRYWAATSLGQIGPAAKDAVPALIEALKD